MASVTVPYNWGGLDLSGVCRNWTQDKDGTQRRMMNRAQALRLLEYGINHLAGGCPRPIMQQTQTASSADSTGAAPLYWWYYPDLVQNGRKRVYHILALPREGAYNANAHALANTNASASTAWFDKNVASAVFPDDVVYMRMESVRGNASGADFGETLSTYNGFTIIDISVQDMTCNELSTDNNNDFVSQHAKPGDPVTEGIVKAMAETLHATRSNNLGIAFNWYATRLNDGGWRQPASSDQTAIVIAGNASDSKNILDDTITSRTATSPGFSCPAQYGGVGVSNCVPVRFYALANATGANVSLKVIGPDQVSNNNASILFETGGSFEWKKSADLVYLNSLAGDDWSNVSRNKLDVHADFSGTGTIYIYGIRGQFEYPGTGTPGT